jgi:hypothetical protein
MPKDDFDAKRRFFGSDDRERPVRALSPESAWADLVEAKIKGMLAEVSSPPSKLTTTKYPLRICVVCRKDRTFRRSLPRQLATSGHRSGIQGTHAGLFCDQPR